MGKRFELIRPQSLTDANYAEFEYLLRWVGRDDAEYELMFLDAEIEQKISSEVINQEDPDRVESLIDREEKIITLSADDLSLNDLKIVGQMLSNEFIQRLKKDGTTEQFAPTQNSFNYRLKAGRYKITFDVQAADEKVWK